MSYSIKEAAVKTGLSVHTLRYYDKEGLLPFIERTETGNRRFNDSDIDWIASLCILRDTGMSIKEIKDYIALYLKGESTLEKRRQIFIDHRVKLVQKIAELEKNLESVEYRIQFYDEECAVLSLKKQN